jgi:hypothetical protein
VVLTGKIEIFSIFRSSCMCKEFGKEKLYKFFRVFRGELCRTYVVTVILVKAAVKARH